MLNLRKIPSYLRHLNWYVDCPGRMPLCSDLDQHLPLSNLKHAKILWPNKYSWNFAGSRLDPIKKELSRLLPVEVFDVAARDFDWHQKGGFPVPDASLIGKPGNPDGPNDIKGEIFEVHIDDRVVRCAYDYSDYPIVSTDIHDQVDVYFKCVAPVDPLPSKVVKIGYFARNPRLLAKARARVLNSPGEKAIDIYGRFGAWTDSQSLREAVVNQLRRSDLGFAGGFAVTIYPAYLKEIMSARIALHLPGQGPVSYRMVEAMALGATVVSPKIACAFPEELVDGLHYVAFKDDGSNVVEVCQDLLKDGQRRQDIVKEAMTFFDRNFSTQSRVRRILKAASERTC